MSAKKTKSDGQSKTDETKPADIAEDALTPDQSSDLSEATPDDTAPQDDPGSDTEASTPENPVEATAETSAELDAEADPVSTEDQEPSEAEAQIASEAAPQAEAQERVERIIERRGGFFPALLGGIVAALLGFAAGSTDILAPYLPASLQRGSDSTGEEMVQLREEIATLKQQVSDIPPPADTDALEAGLRETFREETQAAQAARDTLTARIDAFETRLAEIASASVTTSVSPEAVAAYEQELAAAQAALAQQRSEVEAMIQEASRMEAEAEGNARTAQAQAAATRLFSALDTGSGFAGEVAELQSLGVAVPDALSASAEGVPSLSSLQAEFPDVARTALAAAREAEGASGGVAGFLQRQLGARSVTPREGSDPDAILSRAEAALIAGNLGAATEELVGLPEAAQGILAPWIDRASARLAALSAADELAQSLQTN